MYYLQRDWPRFSLPKFSGNSIYVLNIVKFSNRPIQLSPANIYGFLQSVGKRFLSLHLALEEEEVFENKFFIMFFKMY